MVALLLLIACGAAATATPAPKPAATAVPAPVTAPIAPKAPVAQPPAVAPTPTAVPQLTPKPSVGAVAGKYGGIVPMHDFAFPPPAMYPYKALQQIKNSSGIYNQLVEYNPETPDRNDIRGDLAKSWELSKDGLTYTFRLHENARWHDGKPVTAADVVFSLDSMMEPGAVRPLVRAALGTYYNRGTARAIDAHTVQLPTLFQAPELIPLLSNDRFKIVAKHWVESGTDTDKWENAMGSGPFKPGKFNKDVSVELVKNQDYWKKGLPYIDGMRHITIVDKGTAIAAYKTEQVLMTVFMITNFSSKEAARLQEDAKDKLTVHFVPNTTFVGVMFNSTYKPFDDVRVRRAINLAIHRRPFVETIGAGPGTEAMAPALGSDTWFGKSAAEIATLPGFRELDGKKHPDDLAEAKRLLAEAGFPNGFKADMMVRTVLEFPDMAQIAVDQLRRFLNIDLTIRPIDSATGLARYGKRDYALAVQATAHELIEPDAIVSKVWMPGGLYDEWTGWVPPKWFEEDFYKQSREVDREKRKVILRRMEEYLIHEDPGPYALLYWSPRNWVVNNRIKNLYPGPALWTSTRHENIWCDPKC